MQIDRCRRTWPMHAQGHDRRGLLSRLALGTAGAIVGALSPARAATAQSEAEICRIVGVTGGGVVRTNGGDITLVLFASRFVEGDGQPAEGKVRWLDPGFEGGLSLESVGPVLYEDVEGNERGREVRGVATVNGEFEAPFVLVVTDNTVDGGNEQAPDRCSIQAGNLIGATATPTSEGWGYAAAGELVGGDLILLGHG